MNAPTQLAELAAPPQPFNTSTASLVLDEGNMTRLFTMAEWMATGTATVPKHLQRNKGDCLAVCMQATQWRMNPFAVAQKTHLINGTLGYEAQLIIAAINTSGALIGRLDWEWFGPWEKIIGRFKEVTSTKKIDDDGKPKKFIVPDWSIEDEKGLGVKVRATLRGEAQPRELTLLMTQARTRNSTLWTEDPRQQLAYLASKRWARLHLPEVILGVYTPDEIQEFTPPRDMGNVEVIEPANNHTAAGLSPQVVSDWEAAARQGAHTARKFFGGLSKETRALATVEQKERMWKLAEEADKRRTVDVQPPTASPPVDPATGEINDPFVTDMNAAEAQGAGDA